MRIMKSFTEWLWLQWMRLDNTFEHAREWIAFKIFPEWHMYSKVIKMMGAFEENDNIVKIIEQSNIRNKKAVIELVKTKYYTLDDILSSREETDEV